MEDVTEEEKALFFRAMAKAWDKGFAAGKSNAMRYMSDEPELNLEVKNPYRTERFLRSAASSE